MDHDQGVMLGEIRGDVRAILQRMDRLDLRLDNHGDRINTLEGTKDKGVGFLSASRLAFLGLVGLAGFAKDIWIALTH